MSLTDDMDVAYTRDYDSKKAMDELRCRIVEFLNSGHTSRCGDNTFQALQNVATQLKAHSDQVVRAWD